MASNAAASSADVARRVIDANSYMTLATADATGRPWATPVWFAERDGREFVWVSRPGTQHSRNIADRPEVTLVVFDSSVAVGSATAMYVEAVAGEVAEADRVDALAVFNARSAARGIREWDESEVSEGSQFRLYRAIAAHVWVLDEHDQRVPVTTIA